MGGAEADSGARIGEVCRSNRVSEASAGLATRRKSKGRRRGTIESRDDVTPSERMSSDLRMRVGYTSASERLLVDRTSTASRHRLFGDWE